MPHQVVNLKGQGQHMKRIVFNRLTAMVLTALALLVASSPMIASAMTSTPPANVYKGCVSKLAGVLYNVQVNPKGNPVCLRGDTAITWNETGPAGSQGVQGPAGPVGPAATSTCSPSDTGAGAGKSQCPGTATTATAAATTTWYSLTATIEGRTTSVYRVNCAAGESVTAGGFIDTENSGDVVTDSSGPLADLAGWSFHVANTGTTSHSLSFSALCTTAAIAQAPAPIQTPGGAFDHQG
jgi:hypothetical protein